MSECSVFGFRASLLCIAVLLVFTALPATSASARSLTQINKEYDAVRERIRKYNHDLGREVRRRDEETFDEMLEDYLEYLDRIIRQIDLIEGDDEAAEKRLDEIKADLQGRRDNSPQWPDAIPVHVLPEPVEYVRVCDAFGRPSYTDPETGETVFIDVFPSTESESAPDGFFYIPGTDDCIRIRRRPIDDEALPWGSLRDRAYITIDPCNSGYYPLDESLPTDMPMPPCMRFDFSAGFQNRSVPQSGNGTLILGPGDEVSLNTSPEWVNGFGLGAEFGLSAAGTYFDFEFGYTNASGKSSDFEPVGGRPVAITYDMPLSNGSTGIGLGASGARAESTSDFNALDFRMTIMRGFSPGPVGRAVDQQPQILSPFSMAVGPSFSYSHYDQGIRSGFESLTFDVQSDRDLVVTDDRFGFGVALAAQQYISGGFYIGGRLTAEAVYGNVSVDSTQTTHCAPCAAPENLSTVRFEDQEDYFTFYGDVDLTFGFATGPWNFSLTAGANYTGAQGQGVTRVSPNTPEGHAGTDSAGALDFMLRAIRTLGPPPPPAPPPP